VSIYINRLEDLPDFCALNREWILKYFTLEASDLELFENPAQIIADGGYVVTLHLHDQVVGCCALLRHANDRYELAKMAVAPSFQGRGLANSLILAVIELARSIGARAIELQTNSILEPALALYRKHGFVVVDSPEPSKYSRTNVFMVLDLNEA
jgi:ribosomal protein S18 acetylase RimI-like enzyme